MLHYLCLLLIVAALPTCDCIPHRDKAWRNAPVDPAPSDRVAQSEVLTAEADRLEAQRNRAHTLRVHMDAEPRHLNPMLAPSEWTVRVAADTIFETLVRYVPPEGGAGSGPGRYTPGLARSWQVSPDGLEIRVDLQPGVTFHDGHRLSSVDVQFSLDVARKRHRPQDLTEHLRHQLADVDRVELVTSRAVRVTLKRPNGYVLRALAEVPILPSHIYQKRLVAKRGPVVGTGPYRLESWKAGTVHLVRFDGYWGAAPAIRAIDFVYEKDAARALTAAKRGELDVIAAMIPEHHPEQAAAPGINTQFVPLRLRPLRFRYLAVNTMAAPLKDARVRRAITYLIDRQGIVDKVYDGLARAAAGPVWPGGPADGPAPAPPQQDLGDAFKLLDAAGWRDSDGDGRRERGGKRLRVSLLALENVDPERKLIVEALRLAGFQVDLRKGGRAVLLNRLRDHDFQLALIEWRGYVDQSMAPLLETGGRLNYGQFSDDKVDAVIASLRGVWEPATRAPLLGQLARATAELRPLIPLTADDPYGLIHKRVRGVVVWNGWIPLRELSLDSAAE